MSRKIALFSGILLFLSLFAQSGYAQLDYLYSEPRLMTGGGVAMFRISLDDFESLYSNRWGESYGGFIGVRFYSSYYLNLKYNTFQQSGKSGTDAQTGFDLSNAKWSERWYAIGIRVHPPITRTLNSYYGFGIVFYDVDEAGELSIFKQRNTEKADEFGNGFFLELGVEYLLIKQLGLYLEMEISSGGIRGRTGFEGFSIGGFRFALGLVAFPF
jgi:hypothetical protein